MKKKLSVIIKVLAGLVALSAVVYFAGPKPAAPTFPMIKYPTAASLQALEDEIKASEAVEPGIKPQCEAQIVWADTVKKKTTVAFLYLHGFGASHEEGAPLPINLANKFGCNLFLARLDQHGVEEGDDNLCTLTADSYVASAEKALAIAQQLGDSVVILGTSGGGGLSIFLASRHPEVKGVVTWSPAVRIYASTAQVLSGPWGLQLAHLITGKKHNDWAFKKPEQAKYWMNHQCFEGVIQFTNFLKYALTPATFKSVQCPFFMGYYYKDEENQDKVVSVEAMKEMFEQLGTPPSQKRAMAFPNTNNHVIGSQLISDDWQSVERESAKFMTEVMRMKIRD